MQTNIYFSQTLRSKFQLNQLSSFRDVPAYPLRMRNVGHVILAVSRYNVLIRTLHSKFELNWPISIGDISKYLLRMRKKGYVILDLRHWCMHVPDPLHPV